MLKLNSRQYGQGLIGHLNMFWGDGVEDLLSSIEDVERLVAQVRLIAQLFEDFNRHASAECRDQIFDFAQARLAALRLELFEAGFDPRDPEGLTQRFADDPECMVEYAPLLNEALWQFKALVLEISRRWPDEIGTHEDRPEKPERVWLNEMKLLLSVACPDE